MLDHISGDSITIFISHLKTSLTDGKEKKEHSHLPRSSFSHLSVLRRKACDDRAEACDFQSNYKGLRPPAKRLATSGYHWSSVSFSTLLLSPLLSWQPCPKLCRIRHISHTRTRVASRRHGYSALNRRVHVTQVYGVAHGLLMGHRENVWMQALSLFNEVKQMDSSTASAFYNALTDMLWHFGQRRGAQLVVLEGKRHHVWENTWSDSCLDLHLMSSGAARAMVHAWLLNIRSIVFEGHELPKLLSILTGWGKHSKVVGDGMLKRAIETLLSGMGAPFKVAECNIGRFISSGALVTAWLRESGTLKVLILQDDRTQTEAATLDHISELQTIPL